MGGFALKPDPRGNWQEGGKLSPEDLQKSSFGVWEMIPGVKVTFCGGGGGTSRPTFPFIQEGLGFLQKERISGGKLTKDAMSYGVRRVNSLVPWTKFTMEKPPR